MNEMVATPTPPAAPAGPTGVDAHGRPHAFSMTIQGGMLEALGINMYTTLGKCLVEFVANAYDAESDCVDIEIPVDAIAKARHEIREAARKAQQAQAEADGAVAPSMRGQVLLLALPEDIKVVIRDRGNGMTPEQVQRVFLPINRKRRLDAHDQETNLKTETGKRYAMGRKGLGKLAGFGAAEVVSIETKRRGQPYATRFVMRYAELAKADNIQAAVLPATYIEGQAVDDHYTLIELSGLKCDAVRNGVDAITRTIAEAFYGLTPEEFAIRINGTPVVAEPAEYEFSFPAGGLDAEGFATTRLAIEDLPEPLEYRYCVRFRKRGSHLAAANRGARIYCNGRLAAGPTLLNLPTGMHNFHAQSYMECIVIADELDRFGVDIINTNRTHLRQDSELVEKFLDAITASMTAAIAAHGKFRDREAAQEIKADPMAQRLAQVADRLPPRTRGPIRQLLTTMASKFGVDSEAFRNVAPLVLTAANAGEVLIKLIEVGAHPESIETVASHLQELAEIEKSDALKLYRGRRSGITALTNLELEGEEHWKDKAFEAKLHALFKSEPWLIRPEFVRPVVSDQDLAKLASKLAQHLGVDTFAAPQKDGKDDHTRPDLVFVMADSTAVATVTIVELKSPSLPLEYAHLEQLRDYMWKVDEFLKLELQNHHVAVHGLLIGALPDVKSTAEGARKLLRDMAKRSPTDCWEVEGLRQLIAKAENLHLDAIRALEADLQDSDMLPVQNP